MEKEILTNQKQLLQLYKIYVIQSSNNTMNNNTMGIESHDDSGPGDPDYHCDTHDNYPTMITRRMVNSVSKQHIN